MSSRNNDLHTPVRGGESRDMTTGPRGLCGGVEVCGGVGMWVKARQEGALAGCVGPWEHLQEMKESTVQANNEEKYVECLENTGHFLKVFLRGSETQDATHPSLCPTHYPIYHTTFT